jgi:alkaline phosphatase
MHKNIKQLIFIIMAMAFIAPSAFAAKNVIVMIPDGCSPSIQTLARLVKGSPLNIDPLTSGSVTTYMANSIITGSAAAATAFATGHKTSVRFLGVGPSETDPDGDYLGFLTGFTPTAVPFAPVESILEVAKRNGKATGLVATSRITHATPAAYACHIDDRGKDNEIMEHLVYADIDVVFGGGKRHLLPDNFDDDGNPLCPNGSSAGKRTDCENLLDVLTIEREYQFVENADDMNLITSGKVWGLFASSHMDPELDRDDLHPTQPSIAEMTRKAIDLLSQDTDGFFLMVEGSQVDWAGHSNDAAYMVYDFLAFDEAVGEALYFAKNIDTDTLVLIFPDHNTGALSVGHEQSDFPPGYTATSLEAMIDPIKNATMTIQGLLYKIPPPPHASDVNVRDAFVNYHGPYWATAMTKEHAKWIAKTLNHLGPYDGYYPIAEYVSKHMTAYGWTTHGHTGEDVPLWSYNGATSTSPRPVGTFDNTELATFAADAFGFTLNGSAAWEERSESVLQDTDSANPIAEINDWLYPVSKDYRIYKEDDDIIEYFSDITVWAPAAGKVYIPLQ